MSAPILTQAEVNDLVEKAQRKIALETATRKWADLWPVVEPFTRRESRDDIKDAVEFLICEEKIEEGDRSAAEQAFRRERNRRQEIAAREAETANAA